MKKILNFTLVLLPFISSATPFVEKNWTGTYLGGNVGAIFNRGSIEANDIAFSSWNGLCYQKAQFSSASIGPQLGFQKQFDSKAVIGVEGDYTYNFSQSTQAQCDCEFDSGVYDRFNMKNRYQLSMKGRLGYALKHNIQPFFAAGVSFADLGLSYTNEVNDDYFHTQIRPGYVFGGGIDWALAQHWNARIEYFYNQYNAIQLGIGEIYQIGDTSGFGQLKLSSNNVRFAVNYWF